MKSLCMSLDLFNNIFIINNTLYIQSVFIYVLTCQWDQVKWMSMEDHKIFKWPVTWLVCHMTHIMAQLFAASFLNCTWASPIPLNLLRLIKDLWRRNVGLSFGLLFPAEDKAATSNTSVTLRCEVFAEVSEYTRAPIAFAVFNP